MVVTCCWKLDEEVVNWHSEPIVLPLRLSPLLFAWKGNVDDIRYIYCQHCIDGWQLYEPGNVARVKLITRPSNFVPRKYMITES